MPIKIFCAYDEDAGVWYVEKSDLVGLHVEAESPEAMLRELRLIVPEIVRLDRKASGKAGDASLPVELLYQHRERLPVAC